jgi:hypothetical protein
MINKLKTFTIAMIVAGATVTATRAATVTTNQQVLDNISVQLKFYQQGPLNSTDKTLAAPTTIFTTSDLIKQLVPFIQRPGFTFSKSQKLVRSTTYSNLAFSSGAFSIVSTNSFGYGPGTNAFSPYLVTTSGTNALSFPSGLVSNIYLITNSTVEKIQLQGTNTPITNYNYFTITNNIIVTNLGTAPSVALTNIATNTIAYSYYPLSPWTVISGTGDGSASETFTVTGYVPVTNVIFTNAGSAICIMNPKSGSTPATLVDVDNWLSFNEAVDFNYNNFDFYKETGKSLSGDDFSGTNIATQTSYSYDMFSVFTAWPTNTAPSGQTNIIFAGYDNDTTLNGLGTTTTKLINLTVNGNSKNKAEFQTLASGTVNVTGVGFINGSFTTNYLQTNTFNNVTSTNYTYGVFQVPSYNYVGGVDNYIGTNSVTQYLGNAVYIQNTTNVIATGTITETYLSAGPEIVPMPPQ